MADIELEINRRGLFLLRLATADKHCYNAYGMLEDASDDYIRYGLGGVQQPHGMEEERRTLESAGMELGLALASMAAARHIALRGGPAPYSAESVDVFAEEPDVGFALECLKKAEVLATNLNDTVESARGHLSAAELLRVLNGVGGENIPCLSEWQNGAMDVIKARLEAADLVDAMTAAVQAGDYLQM